MLVCFMCGSFHYYFKLVKKNYKNKDYYYYCKKLHIFLCSTVKHNSLVKKDVYGWIARIVIEVMTVILKHCNANN